MPRIRTSRVLLAILALLLAAELLARTLAPQPQLGILNRRPLDGLYPGIERAEQVFSDLDHSCLQWAPYQHWVVRPNLTRRFFHTNALGTRGRDTPRAKPAGRFRVAVLGGSAAWGLGSTADARTLPGELETRLRELHPGADLEVVNAAQAGYVSAQELIHYQQEIATLDPDLVLLFDGYNDVVADLGNPVPGWPQGSAHLQMRYEDFLRSGRFGADLLLFLRGSRVFDLLFQRLTAGRPSETPPWRPSLEPADTAAAYLRNAAALARLVAPRPLFIALQPVLATTGKPLAPEEQAMLAEREQETAGYRQRVRDSYARIEAGARGASLVTIAAGDAFGNEPRRLFADECHFGDEAARRLGRHIADALERSGAVRLPSAAP